MKVTYSIKFQWSISEIGTPLQGSSKCLCTCSGLLKLVRMQSINVDNGDFVWPHLVFIRQKMYLWKIEDQQNQDINLPFARDPDPSCEWSARCLPRWRAKHCLVELRSRSLSTLQNPATVHTFKSRALWNINRNDCITLINNSGGKTQESRDHARFTCFYALYSNNLEKKNLGDPSLIKVGILKCLLSYLFNYSWPAGITSHILSAG